MIFSLYTRQAAPLAGLAFLVSSFAAQAACTGKNAAETLRQTDPATYSAIAETANQTANGEGILWRVDAPDAAPSYLFGTKHTIDRDITTLIAPVQEIIRNSRLLMVELSPDERADMTAAMQSDPTIIFDMTGGTIEAFLPPDLIPEATAVFAQYGLPFDAAKRMRPWFLQMAMSLPPCAVALQPADQTKVMDNILAQTALDAGVAVQGLEQWEDQMAFFQHMSDHDAKAGLIFMIENFAAKADEHQAVSDLYDQRQIALIWEFSRWQFVNSDYDFETNAEDTFAELERALLTDRNRLMAENSVAEVARGGVVIAVGALHLIGESGLVAAFKREGYNVTRMD